MFSTTILHNFLNIGSTLILPVKSKELMIEIDANIMDVIGLTAPFILFGITIWLLRTQTPYLAGYVIFVALNSLLNQVLKLWIKEERPTKNGVALRHVIEGYGMPSAHAQSSFFSIMFLYLVNRSIKWLIFGLFIGALTLYQRWKYKMHSVEQLGIGMVIGIGFSIMSYQIIYRKIQGS